MENLEGSETVSFVFRLCIRPWDDVLLVSVLKGQNVSGIRKEKGRKDVLVEQISVVLLRVKLLQQQQRYTKDKQTFLGSNAVFEVFWVKPVLYLRTWIKTKLVCVDLTGTESCVATLK